MAAVSVLPNTLTNSRRKTEERNQLLIRHFNTLWLLLVAAVLLYLTLNPDLLTRDSVAAFLSRMDGNAFAVWILLSCLRAAVMMPSTPFILAGGAAFPDWTLAVFLVSYLGIIAGATLVYFMPGFGSYDEYLEERYPTQIARVKEKMQGPYAFWIVVGWSFFPLVPTDVINYVAGIARMSYTKLIAAVILGELPLVTAYVFVGAGIGEWIQL
jgi:uncharacterized membrane protein YdjX (TVP38/TMEM64 family)